MNETVEKKYYSALELYMNRVFKILIIVIPLITLVAASTFSTIKILGYYPNVSIKILLCFDASCLLYFIVGLVIYSKCENKSGGLDDKIVLIGKIFIGILIFIQWNFISYIIPSRDFWAYSLFFVISSVFFLDSKLVVISEAEVAASIILSWILRPDTLLPVRDELFVPEMILRIVFLVLGFGSLWLLTHSIETQLARELEKIANYDTLTMLYNRRYLDTCFSQLLKNGSDDNPVSVIMCDIDDFKIVNDTYGHDCGDMVLKNISNVIRNIVSSRGIVFRYGGEEILALMSLNKRETRLIAEEIRKETENSSIQYGGKSIAVTLTIGMAALEKHDTSESLIKRADANLYYGKNHGKNCVVE